MRRYYDKYWDKPSKHALCDEINDLISACFDELGWSNMTTVARKSYSAKLTRLNSNYVLALGMTNHEQAMKELWRIHDRLCRLLTE